MFNIQNLGEEFDYFLAGDIIDAAAHAPEVSDGRDIVAPRHDPLERMGQQRLSIIEAALLKGFLNDGIGNVFGGARGHGGFDQDQAAGIRSFPR